MVAAVIQQSSFDSNSCAIALDESCPSLSHNDRSNWIYMLPMIDAQRGFQWCAANCLNEMNSAGQNYLLPMIDRECNSKNRYQFRRCVSEIHLA